MAEREPDLRLPAIQPLSIPPQFLGPGHLLALQRSAGNAAVVELLGAHRVVQRCGDGPCDCADDAEHGPPEAIQRVAMGKAPAGDTCDSAAEGGLEEEDEEETAGGTEGVAEEEEVGMAKAVQRYSLKGFPATEEAQMHTAIPVAEAKVKATKPKKTGVIGAITSKTYEYHGEEDFTLCGWTFPSSWYIKIGRKAFDASKCCDLAATIAHEASHTQWYTEGSAQKLECDCFGCSC